MTTCSGRRGIARFAAGRVGVADRPAATPLGPEARVSCAEHRGRADEVRAGPREMRELLPPSRGSAHRRPSDQSPMEAL